METIKDKAVSMLMAHGCGMVESCEIYEQAKRELLKSNDKEQTSLLKVGNRLIPIFTLKRKEKK
jgi:hypothetical protein